MKTFHILFLLFLLHFILTINLSGQNTAEIKSFDEGSSELRFCLNTGLTFSNAIGKGTDNVSFLNGYPPDCYTNSSAGTHFIFGKKFGIGFIKDLNQKFSIGLDINYEEKGCRIPVTYIWHQGIAQAIDEKSNIRLKYIVLPIRLETRFKKMYLESGIYAGVLLDADDYGTVNRIRFERDKDGRYSLIDVGVGVGVGKRIPLSAKSILKLGFTGNWNVTGNESRGMTPGSDHNWFNQNFNLQVNYETML